MHCRSHELQLAALNAAAEHTEVNRVLGTLLTIWNAFHYSPKKAEKLAEIQAELDSPEIKMQKPSDTRWLARERVVRAVRKSLPALVSTFGKIYDETGDAEAHGIATLLTKYNTVACIYMLSDVLHTVAKLQGNLQAKEIDLTASVPGMVDSTTKRLKELKERALVHNSRITHWCSRIIRSLELRKLLSQRKRKLGFFRKCIAHICRASLTISVAEWSRLISCHRCLLLIHVISPILKTTEQKEKIRILIDFYGIAQRAYFDGDETFSQPELILSIQRQSGSCFGGSFLESTEIVPCKPCFPV